MTGNTGRRVVVIGATGNIGSSVVTVLSDDPTVESIIGLSRRVPQWQVPKTQWVQADIAVDPLVELLRGADAVVHAAWLFQPTHRPATTWQTNVLGSLRVFDAIARAEVPALVYLSSVGAYSPGPKADLVDESWPTHGWPGAAYTREKAYLERVLDGFEHQHPRCRVVRLRPAFVFKREAASQQRRLFAGPFLPGRLVRPSTVPVVPDVPGLRMQAIHSSDVASAIGLALSRPVRGAFNIAAEPPVDAGLLAECLSARTVPVPAAGARAAVAALWHLRVVPASPGLFEAALRLPIMATDRARNELGWSPRYSSREAIEEFLAGLRERAGLPTPPLAASVPGGRGRELATGVGGSP
jgi:nucleoside-diphosphate-sugar epimerase